MKELRFIHSEGFKLLNQIEGNAINNCNLFSLYFRSGKATLIIYHEH
jgi:hypothetical protein